MEEAPKKLLTATTTATTAVGECCRLLHACNSAYSMR